MLGKFKKIRIFQICVHGPGPRAVSTSWQDTDFGAGQALTPLTGAGSTGPRPGSTSWQATDFGADQALTRS